MIAEPPFPWAKYGPSLQWCRVCGNSVWCPSNPSKLDDIRCHSHRGRNPCCIDGCKRSTAATHGLALDSWFCSEHWRAFVPPGSPERRIYNRFWRRAKKFGWTNDSVAAFHRVWDRIVSRARARARGDVDMREINRVMGWS